MTKTPVKKETPRKETPAARMGFPVLSLRDEINRLFDEFLPSFSWPVGRSVFDLDPFRRFEAFSGALAPSVDVSETDKAVTITAELPGLDEEDFEVVLSEDGVLSIKGEKKEEKEEKDEGRYLSERRYGAFCRSFRVPDAVDRENIGAVFKKGVLTVTMPKTGEKGKAQRKIEIKSK